MCIRDRTSVFHINISRFSDGFFVSYLWLTYVCLYLELTQQTVTHNFNKADIFFFNMMQIRMRMKYSQRMLFTLSLLHI